MTKAHTEKNTFVSIKVWSKYSRFAVSLFVALQMHSQLTGIVRYVLYKQFIETIATVSV